MTASALSTLTFPSHPCRRRQDEGYGKGGKGEYSYEPAHYDDYSYGKKDDHKVKRNSVCASWVS